MDISRKRGRSKKKLKNYMNEIVLARNLNLKDASRERSRVEELTLAVVYR